MKALELRKTLHELAESLGLTCLQSKGIFQTFGFTPDGYTETFTVDVRVRRTRTTIMIDRYGLRTPPANAETWFKANVYPAVVNGTWYMFSREGTDDIAEFANADAAAVFLRWIAKEIEWQGGVPCASKTA